MCSHPREDPHELLCGGITFGLVPAGFHTLSHDSTIICTSSPDPEQESWCGNFIHGPASAEDKNTEVLKRIIQPF